MKRTIPSETDYSVIRFETELFLQQAPAYLPSGCMKNRNSRNCYDCSYSRNSRNCGNICTTFSFWHRQRQPHTQSFPASLPPLLCLFGSCGVLKYINHSSLSPHVSFLATAYVRRQRGHSWISVSRLRDIPSLTFHIN